jgi:O-antigen/teichoic acid export membrane protein
MRGPFPVEGSIEDDVDAPRLARRVWRGTTVQVLARAWGGLCTLATLLVLAHHLEGAAFGRYTYYLALFVLLDSLTDLGTGNAVLQRAGRDPLDLPSVVSAARRVRLGAATVGSVLVAGAAWMLGEEGAGWITLACLYPLTHSLELSATVFKSRLSWGFLAAARAAAHSLRLLFVLVLVRLGVQGPAPFVVAAAAGSASANLLVHWRARKLLPQSTRPPVSARALLRDALPLGLAGLAQQAYFYVDNLFVRAIEGDVALGHYNAGVRILSYSIVVPVFASQAALPWFARAHRSGRLSDALGRIGAPLFALACLGAGLLFSFTGDLLAVFGEDFRAGESSLRWLLGATAMIHAGALLLTALIATGARRSVLAIAVGGLVLNLAGNALYVPERGIEGAAMATFATETFVAISSAVVLAIRGVGLIQGERSWGWFAGPILFAMGAFVSAYLRGL